MTYKTVAFDGLSLAGKSTMVQMLLEISENAEVVRENTHDPHRLTTSKVNKLLKKKELCQAVREASEEFPDSRKVLQDAVEYSSHLKGSSQKQALLAYLFTAGRKHVDSYVREAREKSDVILDRWQMTGWAYQVDPEGYTWQDIRKLNEELGILFPDIQFLLTCPVQQIPIRRAYREKQGTGTAGQMSSGREHMILPAFLEIYEQLRGIKPIYLVENAGSPVEDLESQIIQAIPTFNIIKDTISKNGFRIKSERIDDLKRFWLEPDRLERIYKRQTK